MSLNVRGGGESGLGVKICRAGRPCEERSIAGQRRERFVEWETQDLGAGLSWLELVFAGGPLLELCRPPMAAAHQVVPVAKIAFWDSRLVAVLGGTHHAHTYLFSPASS